MISIVDFDRDFARALERCGQGEVIAMNGAGGAGAPVLEEVSEVILSGRGPRWDAVEGGDCYFASTDIMVGLLLRRPTTPYRLVSGRFDHPDLAEPVFHAWIEARCDEGDRVVINVSNLAARPLYTIRRSQYLELNNCRLILQTIKMDEFRKRVLAQLGAQGLPRREDHIPEVNLLALARKVFLKTMAARTRTMGRGQR